MGEYNLIRSLKPGHKDLTLMFIVLEIKPPIKTKDNREVRTVRVSDKSASINLSLWDELGKLIQPGDIIHMTKGYVNIFKNCLTLYLSKTSEFQKIGDFCLVFSETPNMSDPIPEQPPQPMPNERGPPQQGPGGPGGNTGPNKPGGFRGPGNGSGGYGPPASQGMGPGAAGGSRQPGIDERGANSNNGYNPTGSQMQKQWPVGGQARPAGVKDKVRQQV